MTHTRFGVSDPMTASSTLQIRLGFAVGAGAAGAVVGAGEVAAGSADASNAEATKSSIKPLNNSELPYLRETST